jgi:hypothetical protein
MSNLLNGLKLTTDFESVVSTISPLRQHWFPAALLDFLRNHSGSIWIIWTVTLHKTLHTINQITSNGAHATTTKAEGGKTAPCPLSAPTKSPYGSTASYGSMDSSAIHREPLPCTRQSATRYTRPAQPKHFLPASRFARTLRMGIYGRLCGLRMSLGSVRLSTTTRFSSSTSFRGRLIGTDVH